MPTYAFITVHNERSTGNRTVDTYLKTVSDPIDYKDMLFDILVMFDKLEHGGSRVSTASHEAMEELFSLAIQPARSDKTVFYNIIGTLSAKGHHVSVQYMESPEIKLIPNTPSSR